MADIGSDLWFDKAKLRTLRRRAGMSQQMVSEKAQISAPHMSAIEAGRRLPSEPVAARIADAIGVSLEQLMADPEQAAS